MVSDRKTTGSLHIIYHGYFESFSFLQYISLALFTKTVCYSVIAESCKQIIIFFFFLSARDGWNLTKCRFDKGNMYHAHALTKTTLPSPYHHAHPTDS